MRTPAVFAIAAMLLTSIASAPAAEKSAAQPAPKAPVPKGYKLLYCQSFDKPETVADLEFTDPDKWVWSTWDKDKTNGALESLGQGKYRAKVRSPRIIGLISGKVFGDFIMEVDLCQTGREYGHRDMCMFFGFTTPSRFYYVHVATKADKNAHNVFIVNDKPRTNIATKTTKGVQWGSEKWHHVRLERKASEGTIRVFYDDMKTPIMEAADKTFPKGLIGFGSFDDSGRVDNIRIWAPKVEPAEKPFFGKKSPGTYDQSKPPKPKGK